MARFWVRFLEGVRMRLSETNDMNGAMHGP